MAYRSLGSGGIAFSACASDSSASWKSCISVFKNAQIVKNPSIARNDVFGVQKSSKGFVHLAARARLECDTLARLDFSCCAC